LVRGAEGNRFEQRYAVSDRGEGAGQRRADQTPSHYNDVVLIRHRFLWIAEEIGVYVCLITPRGYTIRRAYAVAIKLDRYRNFPHYV
jgi:hypothetical protein